MPRVCSEDTDSKSLFWVIQPIIPGPGNAMRLLQLLLNTQL